jgi:hypothetical protein
MSLLAGLLLFVLCFLFCFQMFECIKKGYYVLEFFIGVGNRDIMTKELSLICKFFVLLCLRILFARDKSSLVLSQNTILKVRTVLFRNVLHKLKIFQGI